ENTYAIAFTINSNNNNLNYDLVINKAVKPNYNVLPQSTLGVVVNYPTDYLHSILQLETSMNKNAYYIAYGYECGSDLQSLELRNYGELLTDYPLTPEMDDIQFKNYMMDIQISTNISTQFEGLAGIEVAYYITPSSKERKEVLEIAKNNMKRRLLDINNEYNIQLDRYTGELRWDSYESLTEYQLYIMDTNITEELANNDCFLFGAYEEYKNGSLPEGFIQIESFNNETLTTFVKLEDSKEYFIAIVAYKESKLPTRKEYNLLKVSKYIPPIPEEDFKLIKSFEDTSLILEENQTEAYFLFNNSNETKDVLFRMEEGMPNDTQIDILFYNDFRKISKDFDGEYQLVDYNISLRVSETDYIIKKEDLKGNKFYMIILNRNKTHVDKRIMMFNEEDTKPLKNNEIFLMKYFMSFNEYTFTFGKIGGDALDLILSNIVKGNKHNITLEKVDGEEPIFINSSDSDDYVYHLNESIKGTFKVTVHSLMDSYTLIKKIIKLERIDGELHDLMEDNVQYFYFVFTKNYYFKCILDNYTLNDTGTVTISMDNNNLQKYTNIYGRLINGADNETELLKYVPDSKSNEFKTEVLNNGLYKHLHFKKYNQPSEGQKSILLITVSFNETFSFEDPKTFTIGFSSKAENINLDLKEDQEVSFTYNIKEFIPKYIKYKLPFENAEDSINIFQSSKKGSIIFYNGTYINEDYSLNEDINSNIVFAINSPKESKDNQIISVKIFQIGTDTATIKIVKVKGELKFEEGERKETSTLFELTSCLKPIYYIDSCNSIKDYWTYIEIEYGSAQFYYKSYYNESSILPSEKDLMNKTFSRIGSEFSIMKITCTSPTRGIWHIFDDDAFFIDTLEENSKHRFGIRGREDRREYILPKSKTLNLAFETPYSVDVYVEIKDEYSSDVFYSNIVEKDKPWLIQIDSTPNYVVRFVSILETYLELSIVTNSSLYKVLDQGKTNLNQNALIKTPGGIKNKNVTSFDITLSNMKNDFILAYVRVIENRLEYVGLPSKSGYSNQIIKAEDLENYEYKLHLDGPYDKENFSGDTYYFIVEIIENNSYKNIIEPYDITFKYYERKEYKVLPPNQIGYLGSNSTLSYDTFEMEGTKTQSEDEYLFFVYAIYGEKPQSVNFHSFEVPLNNSDPQNARYAYHYFMNPKLYVQSDLSYLNLNRTDSGISISYKFMKELPKQYVGFIAMLNIFSLEISYSKKIISWTNFDIYSTYNISYELFIFDRGVDRRIVDNELQLNYIKSLPDYVLLKDLIYTNESSYELKMEGNMTAVVVAEVNGYKEPSDEEIVPLRILYKSFDFEVGGNTMECTNAEGPYCFKMTMNQNTSFYDMEYYHCNSEQKTICVLTNDTFGECQPVKKFLNEACEKGEDCYTGKCSEIGKCKYKEIGDSCKHNKECNTLSYCNNKTLVCDGYADHEDDNCTEKECSPQFECINGKCLLKAQKEDDEYAETASLCKSFKLDPNTHKCTSKYDDSLEDLIAKFVSVIYPGINWKAVKYSDYKGKNYGSLLLLNRVWDKLQTMYWDKYRDDWSCATPVMKEMQIYNQSEEFTLSDSDIKEFLNLTGGGPEPDPEDLPESHKCYESPFNNTCYKQFTNDKTTRIIEQFGRCNTEQTYCFLNNENWGCGGFKEFVGAKCSKSDDCFTNKCVDGICKYKDSGEKCNSDKECGIEYYCNSEPICTSYVTEGKEKCSAESKCSPKFVCDGGYCQNKGELEDGIKTTISERCQSFKIVNGTCNSDYNLTDVNDKISQQKSKIFPQIDWKGKLSDFEGENLGNLDFFYMIFDATKKEMEDKYGEANWKCAKDVKEQISIFGAKSKFSFTDEEIQKYIDSKKKKEEDKDTFYITIIIILVVVLVLILGVTIFLFIWKKKKTSVLIVQEDDD
ncbi:MAG: dickkopf-related protein, partial [archaeon]|nr:dickkopf-related protein [archaeon]